MKYLAKKAILISLYMTMIWYCISKQQPNYGKAGRYTLAPVYYIRYWYMFFLIWHTCIRMQKRTMHIFEVL